MQTTFEITEQDFVEAIFTSRNSKASSRWFKYFFGSLACVMFIYAIFLLATEKNHRAFSDALPPLVLSVLWFWMLWGATRHSALRQFQQQPSAHGTQTLTVDDRGLHWQWDGGSSNYEWRNYIRWVEGKNQFLLYLSPNYFNILPKNQLAPDQINEFRTLLTQNIRTQG